MLTVSLLAGLFLAGAMPVMAAPMVHEGGVSAAPMVDCAHHDRQSKPFEHKHAGHADLSCCLNGHCPMLTQGLMPAEAIGQPSNQGSRLRPVLVSLHRGIMESPTRRPPRRLL
ncbi:hypothetical protein [Dongia rigui]|uniref:Uncharacterized protein n=1 Tax=Dongia rigui TaxID=940149 RepID=A0ABU5E1D7_9PROT|nr:hypothetical protein [Dongia rigui]MDY0873422.1 hypothetical protein [Dongia rigui]